MKLCKRKQDNLRHNISVICDVVHDGINRTMSLGMGYSQNYLNVVVNGHCEASKNLLYKVSERYGIHASRLTSSKMRHDTVELLLETPEPKAAASVAVAEEKPEIVCPSSNGLIIIQAMAVELGLNCCLSQEGDILLVREASKA